MSKYLFLLLPFLFGCADPLDNLIRVDENTLKFHAGDSIVIKSGFYSKCYGDVCDYVAYKDKGEETKYEIKIYCNGWRDGNVLILEGNLELAKD